MMGMVEDVSTHRVLDFNQDCLWLYMSRMHTGKHWIKLVMDHDANVGQSPPALSLLCSRYSNTVLTEIALSLNLTL
jgi:hypothetical protein